LDQFIKLWELVGAAVLVNTPDEISWKLTSNKIFSARSAYNFQLYGLGSASDAGVTRFVLVFLPFL
jgi:hypothetical protein